MRASLLGSPPLILATAALCCDVAAANTITDSCRSISNQVNVTFCESRLRSIPGAAAADMHGHLLMAAGLAAASGAAARDAAETMARGERDPAMRDELQACWFMYDVGSVPALRLVRGYTAARSWGAAASLFTLTETAGGEFCDEVLGGSGGRRMAAVNHEFDQLTAMTTLLLYKLKSNKGRSKLGSAHVAPGSSCSL